MAGGVKGEGDAAEIQAFAVAHRLHAAGEALAVAQRHQVEGFLRGQDAPVAGARMVGMAVRDHRLVDRARRVDMEAAGLAIKSGGGWRKKLLGAHLL